MVVRVEACGEWPQWRIALTLESMGGNRLCEKMLEGVWGRSTEDRMG